MKKYLFITAILISGQLSAQSHEINIGAGFSYYLGELNHSNERTIFRAFPEAFYFKNYKASYSIGYRYNLKNNFSLGLNLFHSNVTADDKKNEDPINNPDGVSNHFRNLNFSSVVNHGFIDVKYEPFRTEARLRKNKFHISPYIGVGFGIMSFNPKTSMNGVEYELQPLGTEGQGMIGYADKYSLTAYTIPTNIGVKFTPKSRVFSISIDLYGIFTGTDYLDDVSNKYGAPADFTAKYGANSINYRLADRTNEVLPGVYNNKDEVRGISSNNDGICIGQIRFSYYIDAPSNSYYKCCSF